MTNRPDEAQGKESEAQAAATAEGTETEAAASQASADDPAWTPFPTRLRLRGDRGRFFPRRHTDSSGEERRRAESGDDERSDA